MPNQVKWGPAAIINPTLAELRIAKGSGHVQIEGFTTHVISSVLIGGVEVLKPSVRGCAGSSSMRRGKHG